MPRDQGRSAPLAKPPRRSAPATEGAPRRAERRPGNSRPRISVLAIVILVALALAPACALLKLSGVLDWRVVAAYPAVISLLTWLLYRQDKLQAELGGWRTPESTLHALEVFGGWPAAYLAQRWYRHKIAKRIYQVNFWAIVLLHQGVALDYLQEWRVSQAVIRRLDPAQLLK